MQLKNRTFLRLIPLLLVLGISIGLAYAIYSSTKQAYHEVGLNDGKILAETLTIQRIKEIVGEVPTCSNVQQKDAKEIISVKTESLYLLRGEIGEYRFCRSK